MHPESFNPSAKDLWAEALDLEFPTARSVTSPTIVGPSRPPDLGQRRPRYRRVGPTHRPPLRLNDRDRAMLQLVHDYRLITSRHVQLLISGSAKKLLYRLQKLYHHGYLDRPRFATNAPFVYGLANAGADELARLGSITRGRINWTDKNRNLTERFVAHSLMISDFRTLLTAALCTLPDMTLNSWIGEGTLRHDVAIEGPQHRTTVAPVIPDGSFLLEQPRPGGGTPLQAHFFVEADRSTESGRTRFAQKMRAYVRLWDTGTYKATYGRDAFRVVTITRTPERRDNLRRATQRVARSPDDPVLTFFHFACVKDFALDDPTTVLRPIWRSARSGDEAFHRLLE